MVDYGAIGMVLGCRLTLVVANGYNVAMCYLDTEPIMVKLVELARACAADDTPYVKFVSMVEKLAAGRRP